MAQTSSSVTEDIESLKSVYDEAMKLYEAIENGFEATNSDPVQLNIRAAIAKFEKATRLVSLADMFSANENLEELPTETLQYLLLPYFLGNLTLKMVGRPRTDIINVAEIYFKDFLTRCKNYGFVREEQMPSEAEESDTSIERVQTQQAKIASLVMTREAKIKRYKEQKELKEKLSLLSKALESPNVDDEAKREYFTTLLYSSVNQVVDELSSIEQEKPLLEYMAKHAGEPKPAAAYRPPPLKPVIITKDAVQKAVFGAGYPSLPSMTVEEFYDQRVRDGTFPSASNIPHSTIQSADADPDEADDIRKEQLIEDEDPEELARQRAMDEYKDDHRRGWGNRYNRS